MRFGAYRLRSSTKDDHDTIAQLIASDPDHKDRVKPEFFYAREPGIECFRLEDAGGRPIYFRITRVLRVDVQFGPPNTPDQRAATRDALLDGFAWLIGQARRAGIRQVMFDSVSRPLIAFCRRRFGFQASPNEFVCGVTAPETQKPASGDGNQVQQPSQERG